MFIHACSTLREAANVSERHILKHSKYEYLRVAMKITIKVLLFPHLK